MSVGIAHLCCIILFLSRYHLVKYKHSKSTITCTFKCFKCVKGTRNRKLPRPLSTLRGSRQEEWCAQFYVIGELCCGTGIHSQTCQAPEPRHSLLLNFAKRQGETTPSQLPCEHTCPGGSHATQSTAFGGQGLLLLKQDSGSASLLGPIWGSPERGWQTAEDSSHHEEQGGGP